MAVMVPTKMDNEAPGADTKKMMVAPFVRASDQNLQNGNVDAQRTFTTGAQDLGVFDIPAYGYIRYLYLMVTMTTAANAAAVAFTEDAPWNVLQNIALTEPNGAYIVQFTNGYEAYLADKYSGQRPAISSDPRRSPRYTTTAGAVATGGSFRFILRLPVEVNLRDGVGSLPNQDAAGAFKLRLALAPSATVYGTAPTTLGTIRVQAWLSSWDQPEPTSGGVANQTSPPAVGTTSFWSVQGGITVNAGENVIEIKRKGNYLRQIIFVLRRGGTTRSTAETDWPTETRFLRDAFPARYYNNDIWIQQMFERTGLGGVIGAEALTNELPGGLDNGVRFHDYCSEFNGELGRELRDMWQPTRGSTRLEIAGSFANAGTLTIITNDVAIAEDVFL